MRIEIFGNGSADYRRLYENTRRSIIKLKLIVPIYESSEKDRQPHHMHKALPALYINGSLAVSGKALSEEKILEMLQDVRH